MNDRSDGDGSLVLRRLAAPRDVDAGPLGPHAGVPLHQPRLRKRLRCRPRWFARYLDAVLRGEQQLFERSLRDPDGVA